MTKQERWDPASGVSAEVGALESFIALLQKEQSILLGTEVEELVSLSEQKAASASTLMRMIEKRQAHASAHNITQWPEWIETNHPELSSRWAELSKLAEQAQNLNKTNGELIQIRLRHNQQALSVLNKAAQKAELYGPDGHSSSGGSGRPLGAA